MSWSSRNVSNIRKHYFINFCCLFLKSSKAFSESLNILSVYFTGLSASEIKHDLVADLSRVPVLVILSILLKVAATDVTYFLFREKLENNSNLRSLLIMGELLQY